MKFRDAFRGDFLTFSNILSVLRILGLAPFLYVSARYLEDPVSPLWAGSLYAIIAFTIISDFLDGYLARRWNQTTVLGRYLDPVGDKIVTISSLLILTLHYNFPVWVFAYHVIREILGVWMGTFLYFKRDMQGAPNLWGKWGVGVVALCVIWFMGQPLLSRTLEPGHPLFHPEFAAYAHAFVLTGGIVAYIRTYGAVILKGKPPG